MKLSCEIIKDLLPLYHDGVCSEESRTAVAEHLQTCADCQRELALMAGETSPPAGEPPEKTIAKAAEKAWRRGKRKALLKGAAIALMAALAVTAAWNLCFVAERMPGASMEPTIGGRQLCLYTRLYGAPEAGDIILIRLERLPVRDTARIAAVPGDRVRIEDGTLYVNGEPSELFPAGEVVPVDMDGEITLREDEYFVMGDNQKDAVDSRDDRYGLVSRKDILGKYIL